MVVLPTPPLDEQTGQPHAAGLAGQTWGVRAATRSVVTLTPAEPSTTGSTHHSPPAVITTSAVTKLT